MDKEKSGSNLHVIVWTAAITAVVVLGAVWLYGWLVNQNSTLTNTPVTNSTASTSTTATATPAASATATPASTAGWQTYTNTDYKFTIKYPSGYTFAVQKNLDNLGTGSQFILFTSTSNPQNTISISAVDLTKNGSGITTPTQAQLLAHEDGLEPTSTTNTTIGGQTARIYGSSDGNNNYIAYNGADWFSMTTSASILQPTLASMTATMTFTQ